MSEHLIIERTLEEALKTHLTTQLHRLTDRVNRLEAQNRLLAAAIRRQAAKRPESLRRTRP